ncbi:MAG: nitronate monooxygenase [Calditrichia bacterium]
MLNSHLQPIQIKGMTISVPIIQGGMSVGISLSGLASAVANEGGVGVIGAAAIGMMEPDFKKNYAEANKRALRKEIRKARKKSDGMIGVNIMMALNDFDDLWEVALEEEVDIVFVGAGLPLKSPKTIPFQKLPEYNTAFVPIVSSARAVTLIFSYWEKHYGFIPDAVVVEGPKAGGHLGFKPEQLDLPEFQLEQLVPEVVEAVKPFEQKFGMEIPVIAAGGIYDGADIYKFIELGAKGVQMATRFVATKECDADIKFKEMYLQAGPEDVVIIKSPVGLPGRAVGNSFLNEVKEGKRMPYTCPWHCLKTCDYQKSPYCIAAALMNAQKGRMQTGFAFAGSNVHRVKEIVTVKSIFRELITEYNQVYFESPELVSE